MFSVPYNNATQYRDSGFPSQTMSENTYVSVSGKSDCASKCKSVYNNVYSSDSSCPSYCNFYDTYSDLDNIYSASTMYIPPESAARLYTYPIGVGDDQLVVQPQIVNWYGKTEFNNLTDNQLNQDPESAMQNMTSAVQEISQKLPQLESLSSSISHISGIVAKVTPNDRLTLANTAIAQAKEAKNLYNDIVKMVSVVKSASNNIAPFTVRNVSKQSAIDNMLVGAQAMQSKAQRLYLSISNAADLMSNIAKPIAQMNSTPEVLNSINSMPSSAQAMGSNANMGMPEAYRYARLRRGGY